MPRIWDKEINIDPRDGWLPSVPGADMISTPKTPQDTQTNSITQQQYGMSFVAPSIMGVVLHRSLQEISRRGKDMERGNYALQPLV